MCSASKDNQNQCRYTAVNTTTVFAIDPVNQKHTTKYHCNCVGFKHLFSRGSLLVSPSFSLLLPSWSRMLQAPPMTLQPNSARPRFPTGHLLFPWGNHTDLRCFASLSPTPRSPSWTQAHAQATAMTGRYWIRHFVSGLSMHRCFPLPQIIERWLYWIALPQLAAHQCGKTSAIKQLQ